MVIISNGNKDTRKTKFHYQLIMREIRGVIDGIIRIATSQYNKTGQIYKIWFNECNIVYKDRLLFAEDIKFLGYCCLPKIKQTFKI